MLELWNRAGLFRELTPERSRWLAERLEAVELQAGEVLFRLGEAADAMFLIVRGAVEIVRERVGTEVLIDTLVPGEPVGELQLLAGGARTATARAREPTSLVRLSRSAFEGAAGESPSLVTEVAELIRHRLEHYRVKTMLPRLFDLPSESVIAAVEADATWVRLRRNDLLFRQGEGDQSLYVLMRGRLQAEVDSEAGRRVVGQILPGESVGEMALFTGEDRSATVRAARDSELIRLSPEAFRSLSSRHPELVTGMTRLIIQRLRESIANRPAAAGVTNLTLLPTDPSVSLGGFARELAGAMAARKVLLLSGDGVEELLRTPGIARIPEDDANAMRLEIWLDEQESGYEYIIFVPDAGATPWSWRCLRRADRILLLGEAGGSPAAGQLERTLFSGDDVPAPRTLVLIHDPGATLPSGTARWLEHRSVERCLHIRRGREEDVRRVARLLNGTAVGVVLSGGGAKGFAHLGVLRALEERGVPVDMIGGSSMGSIAAAGYAKGMRPLDLAELSKRLFAKYRPFQEYTIPMISLIRGRRLDRLLEAQTGDTCIEDLWIPFFCVSTDLTAAAVRIHVRGSLFAAVRSSISIPGVLPPVIDGDHLLVDGGMSNNLPGDIMREHCRGTVIVVDTEPDLEVQIEPGLKEFPSPWRILWSRIKPFGARMKLPDLAQILTRTSVLSSVSRVAMAKAHADFTLRPPVDQFGLLEFGAIDRIVEAGYRYATEATAGWEVSSGVLAVPTGPGAIDRVRDAPPWRSESESL
jgi:predicted acylesterase/phospholipase RssA/CRP-like cAMP-binding protein